MEMNKHAQELVEDVAEWVALMEAARLAGATVEDVAAFLMANKKQPGGVPSCEG